MLRRTLDDISLNGLGWNSLDWRREDGHVSETFWDMPIVWWKSSV